MSANMMYRLAAYSYFRASVAVEKKREEGGEGRDVGGGPTFLLSTSRAPSRLSEQRKNAAASTAVTHFFSFFSLFFCRLFSFSNLRVKMAANKKGHADLRRTLNYSQRFQENIEQILKESRG